MKSLFPVCALVVCACLASIPEARAELLFQTWGPQDTGDMVRDEGIVMLPEHEWLPVWLDVTQDGAPDLLFVSSGRIDRLARSPEGVFSLKPLIVTSAPLANPPVSGGGGSPAGGGLVGPSVVVHATANIDCDGDGIDELLLVEHAITLWRVVAPDHLEQLHVPFPVAAMRDVSEVSVGDLNRDGLPDLYLSIGFTNWERLASDASEPDSIIMNRGGGRFEAVEHTFRFGTMKGVTVVDMDGDGWLDLVESVDTSTVAGPSRIMLNRTAPGDTVPTFVPSEHEWDPGTDGMGVAVGDLNEDGHLDIYNTSFGHDLLVMGQADGSFHDATYEAGILHEWTSLGPRVQWSPNFVDLNLDGRLDILVRHGLPLAYISHGPAAWAADLIYLQEPSGVFTRVPAPATPGLGDGKRFAVGDIDSDGRPDVARDGLSDAVLFWYNATPPLAQGRRLSVRFVSSVSGSPPVGTVVVATCGGSTITRHITSGGKMGAVAAVEANLAWSSCTSETIRVEVRWPSGVVTSDEVPAWETSWQAHEPRWFESGAGDSITLDPTGTGADTACIESGGEWSCCTERCERNRASTGVASLRLGDAVPMTLPARESSWLLAVRPYLIRAGEVVDLHVMHIGDATNFPGGEVALYKDGTLLPWSMVDDDAHLLVASSVLSTKVATVQLELRDGDEVIASWSRDVGSVGAVFQSAEPRFDLYPVRPVGTFRRNEFWEVNIYTNFGITKPMGTTAWSLSTPEGEPIPILEFAADASYRRIRLTARWNELGGVDTLFVRDHPMSTPLTLPVVQPSLSVDALDHVGTVQCGLLRSRLEPFYGMSFGVLTVRDHDGNPMLLDNRLIELEVEGATVGMPPSVLGGLMDMSFSIFSGPVTGPGVISVLGPDKQELGRCKFEVVAWAAQPVALEKSWATLSRTELDGSAFEATRLRIGVANSYGELLGSDVWPTVILEGGKWSVPLRLTNAGSLAGDIVSVGGAESIQIVVSLEGKHLESFTVDVTNPVTTEPDGGETSNTDAGGCASTHRSAAPALVLLLLIGLLWVRRSWLVCAVSTDRASK